MLYGITFDEFKQVFVSGGQGYFWTREGKLQPDKEQEYIEDAAPVGLMDMPREPEPKKEDGFTECRFLTMLTNHSCAS